MWLEIRHRKNRGPVFCVLLQDQAQSVKRVTARATKGDGLAKIDFLRAVSILGALKR